MMDAAFQRRLRAILDDPVLSLTVLDPRTEEPYQQLCELFMESNEEQRAHIRAGWPYGREWRIPVPGNAEALFREVASAAIPEMRKLLIDWISEPERQSPEDGGWRLVETPDGPRYKLRW